MLFASKPKVISKLVFKPNLADVFLNECIIFLPVYLGVGALTTVPWGDRKKNVLSI